MKLCHLASPCCFKGLEESEKYKGEQADNGLIATGFVLVLIYSWLVVSFIQLLCSVVTHALCVFFSQFGRCNLVKSRAGLAFASMLTSGMAIGRPVAFCDAVVCLSSHLLSFQLRSLAFAALSELTSVT